jgi:hypothetical protein
LPLILSAITFAPCFGSGFKATKAAMLTAATSVADRFSAMVSCRSLHYMIPPSIRYSKSGEGGGG